MKTTRLAYLDDGLPAYLVFESDGTFVDKITFIMYGEHQAFQLEGFEIIYELPYYLKDLPVRLPPDPSEGLEDLIYYDIFLYEQSRLESIEIKEYPKYPFELSELVDYFQSWGEKGWKYLEF
jgi:hypothetical protein